MTWQKRLWVIVRSALITAAVAAIGVLVGEFTKLNLPPDTWYVVFIAAGLKLLQKWAAESYQGEVTLKGATGQTTIEK